MHRPPTSTQALDREANLYDHRSMRMAAVIARGGVTGGAGPTMLDMVRQRIDAALDEREALRTQIVDLESTITTERDGNPSEADVAALRSIRDQITPIDESLTELQARAADLETQQNADDEARRLADERARQRHDDPDPDRRNVDDPPAGGDPAHTRNRGSIYQADRRHSFFQDALRAQTGDTEARDRVSRSNSFEVDLARRNNQPITVGGDELRAGTTANFDNLVIPEYLVSEAALFARAGAPFLNVARELPLPATGMAVNLGRVTTSAATGVQAAENAAPVDQQLDVSPYNPPVVTITGKNDLSRQAVDRGTMVDEIIAQDLFEDYYEQLDAQLINGSGAAGQHLGVLNVAGINTITYTDVSPTAAEAWPKLADAAQQIGTNRKRPMDLFVLHTRRWGWFHADTDTAGRPLIVPTPLAQNPTGTGGVAAPGLLGYTLAGAPVLQDPNVPVNLGAGVNEDRIIGLRVADMPVFVENGGVPRTFRFDQLSAESITLAVWGYSAFASGRYPASISVISGTGLITPTF